VHGLHAEGPWPRVHGRRSRVGNQVVRKVDADWRKVIQARIKERRWWRSKRQQRHNRIASTRARDTKKFRLPTELLPRPALRRVAATPSAADQQRQQTDLAVYSINLTHFDDIQPSNAFGMPDSWSLTEGMRLAVKLKNGATGALVLKNEHKPGCWRAEWDRDGSPMHGRVFEIGKRGISDIMPVRGNAMPANTTWTTLITLAS
jgi:hypothetical protein